MKRVPYDLDVLAEDGKGDPLDVHQFVHMTVTLRPGGLTGSTPKAVLQLQATNVGKAVGDLVDDDFDDYGSAADSGDNATVEIAEKAYTFIRVVTSGYVSGTPSASFAGDDSRTV